MIGQLGKDWRQHKLSENFGLGEFYKSKAFPDIARGMTPTKEQVDSLMSLCSFGLQRVRDEFGAVTITSGVRDELLNKAIGGARSSQHCRGKAADFLCNDVRDMVTVYHWCKGQLEWPGELFYYSKRGHIHMGIPEWGIHVDQAILDK